VTASPAPGKTPSPSGGGPQPVSCQATCLANLSQLRFTWYDSGGLNLSAVISPGSCAPLTPEVGETGMIQMANWLKQSRENTGLHHETTFTLEPGTGSGVSATTANGGSLILTPITGGQKLSYTVDERPFARMSDGANFPVVFDLCLTVGDQTITGRLVCQPKPTGMLCHEG
jgi:hypothetical protein